MSLYEDFTKVIAKNDDPARAQWIRSRIDAALQKQHITRDEHTTLKEQLQDEGLVPLLRAVKRFNFRRLKREPLAVTRFTRKQLTRLQLFVFNYLRVAEEPAALPFEKIDELLRHKFSFVEGNSAQENVKRFIEWAETHLLFLHRDALLESITTFVKNRYGEGVAAEFTEKQQQESIADEQERIKRRAQRLRSLGHLHRRDIFNVYMLHKAHLLVVYKKPSELRRIDWQALNEECKQLFLTRRGELDDNGWIPVACNYRLTRTVIRTVKEAVRALDVRYANSDILFLARDGLLFYEAFLHEFPNKAARAHVIYVSRATLNVDKVGEDYVWCEPVDDAFSGLKRYLLAPAVKELGYTNIEPVIDTVKERIDGYLRRSAPNRARSAALFFQSLASELYTYLRGHIGSRTVVFFDSSSQTFPVLLSAFSRLMFPNAKFEAFFGITPFLNPSAGFLRGKTGVYFTDMLSDSVKFNHKRSSVLPYDPHISAASLERRTKAFLAHLLIYAD